VQDARFKYIVGHECRVSKAYEFNQRFVCISGHRFWQEDGNLLFTPGEVKEQKYRSIVQVCFSHPGLIYANTNANVNMAIRRIIARREPGSTVDIGGQVVTVDEALFIWQNESVALYTRTLLEGNRFRTEALEPEWYVPPCDLLKSLVRLPHPKRLLRQAGYDELEMYGLLMKRWQTKAYIYKMKKDEWAKPGKYPRMIGDLGVLASLVGAFFTGRCKEHREQNDYKVDGCRSTFVKSAESNKLSEIFYEAWFTTDPYYIAVHSDDSLLSIATESGRALYNMDISSCDSSHGPAVYRLLESLYPDPYNTIARLVEQLTQPITIVNVEGPKERVTLRPVQPVLYSGSTLTTLVNTIAVDLIYTAIVKTRARTEEEIIRAARTVGYGITLERAKTPPAMQFLKHSPVLRDGVMIPVKNLGVLIRAWGITRGDLPTRKKPYEVAARQYQGDLLHGVYANISCPFLTTLRVHYPSTGRYVREVAKNWYQEPNHTEKAVHYTLTDEEFFSRYTTNVDEISNLVHSFTLHNWSCVYDPLANRALGLDYGLNW